MFFEKVKRNNGFDCYAFMVDYENMGLEWPDGYETAQMQGQAPIGVNDNYLFFAQNDQLHMLDFGGLKEQISPLAPGAGAAFNKSLEAVALQNEEKENAFSQLENLIGALEVMTRVKHGENDLDDMTVIMIVAKLEGLLSKLSQSNKEYSMIAADEDIAPSQKGQCGIKFHIHTEGKEVTLESVLDDIDGAAFRPALEKMNLANIDLYAVWADWSSVDSQIRPTGYERQNRCPVGINNNDIIFNLGGMIYQVNVMNGKLSKVPFDNIMPKLEQAANKSDAYFKEYKIEMEDIIGKLICFAMNPRDVRMAAEISEDMQRIWEFSYRITTEHVINGRGQFISLRNNRVVTLEEMIEIL